MPTIDIHNAAHIKNKLITGIADSTNQRTLFFPSFEAAHVIIDAEMTDTVIKGMNCKIVSGELIRSSLD
jgi:hypothetical protein